MDGLEEGTDGRMVPNHLLFYDDYFFSDNQTTDLEQTEIDP
jgi:hypothetical protein